MAKKIGPKPGAHLCIWCFFQKRATVHLPWFPIRHVRIYAFFQPLCLWKGSGTFLNPKLCFFWVNQLPLNHVPVQHLTSSGCTRVIPAFKLKKKKKCSFFLFPKTAFKKMLHKYHVTKKIARPTNLFSGASALEKMYDVWGFQLIF